jgi:hypothetical protein
MLDSTIAKRERAYEHIEALRSEVETFFKGEPYVIESIFEDDGRKLINKVRLVRRPSDKFGVMIGDAVFNLRSSLDHLVWALSDKPSKASVANQVMFSIYPTRKKYREAIPRRLHGVTKVAQAEIEKFQPFRRKYTLWTGQTIRRFSPHPLAVLNELSNTDKHRLIYAAGLSLVQARGTTSVKATSHWVRKPGPFPDGARILEWAFPTANVQMETAFSFDLTIRLRKLRATIAVVPWLMSIEQFIGEEVIPSLGRPECLRP